jgi:hypothetical protein
MAAFENDSTVYVYGWKAGGTFLYSFGGFGEIAACRGDYYNRVWIWDKGCNCLKVLDRYGIFIGEKEKKREENGELKFMIFSS